MSDLTENSPLDYDRLPSAEVHKQLLANALLPGFYHADAQYAQQILDACYAAGLRVFQFANRGDDALGTFTRLRAYVSDACPDLLLGIGTIYNAKEAELFIQAGADFVVQPITTADVAAICRHYDVVWVPGVTTLNEVFQATRLGASLVKVFPASVLGPAYVKAMRGPMPNVKVMVTGGVEPTVESLAAWFDTGVDCVGIGSQLFRNFTDSDALRQRLTELVGFVKSVQR